ncbi:MAG: MgtC/SapB family protein [Tepidisphaeraceae bacterium]
MELHLTTWDILLRVALSLIAGGVLGINRSEHGQPAGFRTTMLVCLAATLAMLLAVLLASTRGKAPDSFVQLDMMRLPLGILTGIGFIGAGAIFRRRDMVRGVTTAATIWFVTVIGLCFGAGMFRLGILGAALGWLVLTAMNHLENRFRQRNFSTLSIAYRRGMPLSARVRELIKADGGDIQRWSITYSNRRRRELIRCIVHRQMLPGDTSVPAYVQELAAEEGVHSVQWDD